MSKGRKRTPLKILQARGSKYANPNNNCAYRTDELDTPSESIKCPEDLTGEAKTAWEKIVKQLQKHKIICRLDENALEIYAKAFAQWKQASADADKGLYITVKRRDGGKELKVNPAVKIANDAAQLVNKIATDFGLSPVARTRVKSVKPKSIEDEAEEFLNNA
jgi:P27 family predicted phage terminase small subunit